MFRNSSLWAAIVCGAACAARADEGLPAVVAAPEVAVPSADLPIPGPPPPIAVREDATDQASKAEKSAADEIVELYPLDNEEWLKDPFLVLDMEMESVVIDFNDGKPRPPADKTQPRIVSRFDTLVELLEKKSGGTGPGGGVRPAEASVIRKGPGGMGELVAPKKNGRGFEDLTPREREKILQSKTEGFPPGFEDVLADYFRRLSKAEQPAPTDSAPAAPTADSKTGSE